MDFYSITQPEIHQLSIRDADGEIFRLDKDGTVTADVERIRAAASETTPNDYAILCRALVWALDQNQIKK